MEAVPNKPNSKGKQTYMQVESGNNENPPKSIRAKDIAKKIKSLDHFVYVWGTKAQYYLPPTKYLTWHYVSQIIAKEKKLLKLSEIGGLIELPKAKGILVNDIWEEFKDVNDLHMYFPDIHDSQFVPRTYFYNVILKRF